MGRDRNDEDFDDSNPANNVNIFKDLSDLVNNRSGKEQVIGGSAKKGTD